MQQSSPPAVSPAPILVVSAGNALAPVRSALGDFDDWIVAGLGATTRPVRRVDARGEAALPAPRDCAGVVVTGSAAMVTDRAAWSERLAAWLRECVAAGTPLLGICFGHQLLAHALGGEVGYRAEGMEIGTHAVELVGRADDPLFEGLPPVFAANLVHSQSVLALPPDAVLLARSAGERHQAFRVGSCAWGVQFHPEFSAAAMRGYVQQLAPAAAGVPVQETPEAASLLARFARLVQARTA